MLTASLSDVSAQQVAKVTDSGIGYLEYLPQGYQSNSNKYPVVISLHGIKEKGTTSTDRNRILADLSKVDNVGLPRYVQQGMKYPFILISPQLKSNYGTWPSGYIVEVVNYVKKHLRVDDRRIYLTGLSLGGLGVWKTAGDYPRVFAAVAPVCAGGNSVKKAGDIAAADLPVWAFHGGSDHVVPDKVTLNMVNAINAKKPNPLAKVTIFPGMGHSIWDKAYKETGLLDWMLRQRKGSSPPSDDNYEQPDNSNQNRAPIVKAGSDKTIVLPANAININGSATDPDGKIESYRWTQVSGGTASMRGTSTPKMRAYNLREGSYMFRLTAKDDAGVSKSDDVRITVRKASGTTQQDKTEDKPSAKNILPVASAGPDRTITLPTSAVTVKAVASDRDGKIVSYGWTQTYGRSATLSGATTPQVRISRLDKGKYIFRLRVKDNDGGTHDDFFKITVNGPDQKAPAAGNTNSTTARGSRSNALPIAYAGPDRVITLPTRSVNIQAQASDRDGRIVSYQWTKTYGNRASISGGNSQRVRIYNLDRGVYIFRLRVKDNAGNVRDDYFKITVRAGKDVAQRNDNNTGPAATAGRAANTRPVANAGPDRRVTASQKSVRLSGSGKDRDGRIVSYHWRKIAGPGHVALRKTGSGDVIVSDLQEGRYYFSLTVEDEDHARDVDKMQIRVTGS